MWFIIPDQITVCLGDSFFDKIKGAEKYVLEISDELGTSWCSNLSQIFYSLLTFTLKLNKNSQGSLSSITFFLWINKELDDITILEGRFIVFFTAFSFSLSNTMFGKTP